MKKIYDVLIIGAGLSGIDAAYHTQTNCPNKEYLILEGRASMGGTWDLFKYPGLRSDSDMYTLGFPFYPWKNPKAIADGPSILSYIKETASHFGIDKKIKFNHKVIHAAWSDHQKVWTLTIAANENMPETTYQTKFLFMSTGYYNYDNGYQPIFKNSKNFKGKIVHPQQWDTSLNYENKKIVVIGSGATAITIVPEMAKTAKHVTMLQRSPSYLMYMPSKDKVADLLNKLLPKKIAYSFIKWKNILISILFYSLCRAWPDKIKKFLTDKVEQQLLEKEQIKHFKPKYNPWDQRLCIVPDGDFFKALRKKTASVVTDTIQEFNENGILLSSGKQLDADIIVSATGLELQLLGGMKGTINNKEIDTSKVYSYKGVMFSGVPNFAIAIGYTNASWTLKCDLNCQYFTRLINYMDKNNYKVCTPKFDANLYQTERLLDFDAGYVLRAEAFLPKQGSAAPWKVHQNYLKDTFALKYSSVNNEHLEFTY